MTKVCKTCEAEFETEKKTVAYCCEPCRRTAQLAQKHKHYEKVKGRSLEAKTRKAREGLSIADVVKLAREAGMSYGQYVGRYTISES